MSTPRFASSLRARFNALVCAIYLVVALGSLGGLAMATQAILAEFAGTVAVKQALLERGKILSAVEREVALARALAYDPVVAAWVADEENYAAKNRALDQLENYRSLFRDHSYFVAIDKTKHYYINNGPHDGNRLETALLLPDHPSDRWFFNTMATVDDYALNLDYNVTIKAAKVWINVIMRDSKGRKTGIGGSGMDISAFVRDVVTPEGEGVSAVVVDAGGVVQAHADAAIVEKNAAAQSLAEKVTLSSLFRGAADSQRLSQAFARLTTGQSVAESFPALSGAGPVQAAIAAIPELGWYNVVLVDVSRVINAKVFLPTMAILAASLLAVMLLVSVLTGRLVIAPVLALTRAAQSMSAGGLGLTLPSTRADEIGQLTQSFNHMSQTLKDYTQNLESKVESRTAQLTKANHELSQSRQRIMESLAYASTIQTAILPRKALLDQALPERTVLYLPRDIVGGDLYYLQDFPTHTLLGVLDCTGHGVPGAFMAMTAHSVLAHVTATLVNDDPAAILRETDRVLRNTLSLHETGEDSIDCGMDMALCCIWKTSPRLVFCGAGLPLFVQDAGRVSLLKGDRRRIGYRGAHDGHTAVNHEVEQAAGLRFFIATDGFWDEGGGDKGYGFGMQRFTDMLAASAHMPLSGLDQEFVRVLEAWRGARQQRDDITVVGFAIQAAPAPGPGHEGRAASTPHAAQAGKTGEHDGPVSDS